MKRWLGSAALALAALAAVATLGAPAAAAEAAGYVLSLQGRWSVQGSGTALAVGSPVAEGATLVAAAPAAGDRITVVAARGGALLLARRCGTPADCAQPIALPRPARGADSAGLLDRIVARLASEPDRYVTTLSRGPAPLPDAVLAIGADGVDVAPVLEPLRRGRYAVQLVPARCAGTAGCEAVATLTRADWAPGQRALVPAAGVAAGVYELVVLSPPGTAQPPRPHSRVLLVPPAEQPHIAERLAAGRALAESWGSDVDVRTKRAFVHALLDVLAER